MAVTTQMLQANIDGTCAKRPTYKQLQQFLRSDLVFFFVFLGCVFANFLTRTCTRSSLPGNFEQP